MASKAYLEGPGKPTFDERLIMATTERVVSVFSILGILFIIVTYIFSKSFKRPINRLVFFASWGNLGMNLAALIAEDGPIAGQSSPLCQFQGFLVQMFLGVDAYWSLCMALNVYLVFFGGFDTHQLRKLDLRYILCCYGLAFIPSLVFIFIKTDKGEIYGDAVMWCWVQTKWAVLRIGLVYSISWIAIGLAILVYIMAGVNVYRRRDQLQPGFMNPLNDAPLKSVVTTEISVTVESASKLELDNLPSYSEQGRQGSNGRHANFKSEREVQWGRADKDIENQNYNVNVRAPDHMNNASAGLRTLTRNAAEYHTNTEALLYARAAFFYFLALLIIWLPSSANRAYSVAQPEHLNFALNYLSGLLLSAQGFLNVIVYMFTSREPMKELFGSIFRRRHPISRRKPMHDDDQVRIVRHHPDHNDSYWS